METSNFVHLLCSHAPITLSEVDELSILIEKYSYFQCARALQLKGLKTNFDIRYNQSLKITAAYTTDRGVLFDYITSNDFLVFVPKEKISTKKIESTIGIVQPIVEEHQSGKSVDLKEVETQLEMGKPLNFKSTDSFSFHEWLQLATINPIERTEKFESSSKSEEINTTNLHSSLIDSFINIKPKIIAPDKNSPIIDIAEKSNNYNEQLMTETLARVYLEQKKYKSAIKAYKILSLKYPEKSGYFADQIKAIIILQNNTKS